MTKRNIFIGTAGWSIPRALADAFPEEGTQLERYAARMNCVEINSSFYRSHRPQTYERWAQSTPAAFRFAVKLPKQITHERRMVGADDLFKAFVSEAEGLGPKWAVLLVQLPPSLHFDVTVASTFFEMAHAQFKGAIVCEARHASWFSPEAEKILSCAKVSRVAADPANWPGSDRPGGSTAAVSYFRWHGSPRMYWSAYDDSWLRERVQYLAGSPDCWCIFDNTASGAALDNARRLQKMV